MNFLVLKTMAINLADVTTICHYKTAETDDYHIYRRNMDAIIVNSVVDKEDFNKITLWFNLHADKEVSPYERYRNTPFMPNDHRYFDDMNKRKYI